MNIRVTPGNSFACRINTHREGWDGSICSDPANWNCLADVDFRTDFCARGDPRCFQLDTFRADSPSFVIEENGAGWLLRDLPAALDDQILILHGWRATHARGIPDQHRRQTVFGAYRIRSVEPYSLGSRTHYRVYPHPDGFAQFSDLHLDLPRYERVGGPYINQLEEHQVDQLFAPALAERLKGAEKVRFQNFCANYPKWKEIARKKLKALCKEFDLNSEPIAKPFVPMPAVQNKALSGLRDLFPGAGANLPIATILPKPAPARAPASARAAGVKLEAEPLNWISNTLGADVCLELQVAFSTRELVILRGAPGVGKSYLAMRLLADPDRERTLVIPVSATWRGREDLLGYVNPMDGKFVPTAFTEFLEESAQAWNKGDRRARVVVFEEFNLSQPEHWLADVLAVSQFEDERDRRIQLAGEGASRWKNVMLSPGIRFVATVNSDHTTRPLSPRVLDRSAVIELDLNAKSALERVGLKLNEQATTAIADLDFILSARGASFSLRTARALAHCIESKFGATELEAADLVLTQQVLSKVSLSAHDPSDLACLGALERWCEGSGTGLQRSTSLVASWRERLDAGLDLPQV